MPERNWKIRIAEILAAIERIEQYTAGMDFNQFKEDQKTIDAVIRNLEIIGEAVNFVPVSIQDTLPEIPWSKMRGIRNVVAHQYFGVSLPIIWNTIQTNLKPLVNPLRTAINEIKNQ
jgi:uncharacterized protein with HEPN domain